MSDLGLRPCPHCNHGDPELDRSAESVRCDVCGMYGPDLDQRGEKWNALPRREDLAKLEAVTNAAPGVDPDEAMLMQAATQYTTSAEIADAIRAAGGVQPWGIRKGEGLAFATDLLEAIRARKRGE